MAIKPHIPWRQVSSNPFNKDKFKGNNEKINDWDLNTTVYVYEPQSLAELGDEANELEYQRVWNKFKDGGHIRIYLVPYREMPEMKMEITSVGASYDGVDKDETIAGYTNVKMGERPTKRFYSFKKLEESIEPIDILEIFEENNLTEVINNDSTFKQTTFTLNKFQEYDGGENSYYRDVKMFYGIFKPENITHAQIEFDVPTAIGEISIKGNKGNGIKKETHIEFIESLGRSKIASFGYIENGKLVFTEENELFVNMLVPKVADSRILWNVPWSWEYEYAYMQFISETTGVKFLEGGENGTDSPNSYNDSWFNLTEEFIYEGGEIEYKSLFDQNATETGKEVNFFLPYIFEFGLPRGLSSYGTTYVSDSGDSANGGILSFDYTDGNHNGARSVTIEAGPWSTKSTIFAVDLAYDPTSFAIAGDLNIFFSKIKGGVFVESETYLDLISNLFDGNPIYDGNTFISEFGILEDIENKSMDRDLRKWNLNDDWILGLLPVGPAGLNSTNIDSNGNYLDSKYNLGPSTPKIDLGLLDFNPATLRTNATSPFFGKYIDEDKIMDRHSEESLARNILFKIKEKDSSQFNLNYYSFASGTIKLKLFTKSILNDYIEIENLLYENERSQGRNLSGGTIITFI